MSDEHEEPEQSFEDKAKKLPVFGNLSGAKYAFVANDFETFEKELKLAPYQYFRANYEGASDFDGSPAFVVTNFVTRLVAELEEKYSKYFFNVYRCIQPSSDEKKYKFESLWIINTPEFAELYGDRRNDFTWTQIDSGNSEEFTQFLLDFRRLPVPEIEQSNEPEIVYEDYTDPFSFGGYDDDEEPDNDTTLDQVTVDPETGVEPEHGVEPGPGQADVVGQVVDSEQCAVEQVVNPEQVEQVVNPEQVEVNIVMPTLNVLISEQYLH